jgi:2,4-dienoyl-CoA reductase (NADPH2)
MLANVLYKKVDDKGLHILVNGEYRLLPVDNVVVCAGQVSQRDLFEQLSGIPGLRVHLLGGASEARELDAKQAIEEGTRLACGI